MAPEDVPGVALRSKHPDLLPGCSSALPAVSHLENLGNNFSLRGSQRWPALLRTGQSQAQQQPFACSRALREGQSLPPILLLPETQSEVSFAAQLILPLSWRRDMFLSLPPADKTCIKVVGE